MSEKPGAAERRAGNAWAGRPARRETLSERRITASRGRKLEVTRYEDTTIYDQLLAATLITPRQHDAARITHMLMLASGLVPRVVVTLETLAAMWGETMPGEVFDPEPERERRDPDAPTPRDKYRAIMRRLGGFHAGLVEAMLLGAVPARGSLEGLAQGLDRLGDMFGLR